MLPKTRWLTLAVAIGAALALIWRRWHDLGEMLGNFRRYSMPSAALYDAWATPVLGRFYDQVAKELVEIAPTGRVLEIGSGPGRLAIKLAELAPEIHVTGLDIAPEMVERANALAALSRLADRAIFKVGDVASLPFIDESFDLVVSTLSQHHWAQPEKGLAEIHRVLRADGVAMIYDVVDWIRRIERTETVDEIALEENTFGEKGGGKRSVAVSFGPVALIYRAELKKQQL